MRFVIRFFNVSSKKTERHIIETHTTGQALRTAIALTIGKDVQDMMIVQED